MWAAIAATIGALLGYVLYRNLATLSYRRPDEQHQPRPARPWWLIPAMAVAWGSLVWRHQHQPWPALALWLPLVTALGWLAAVDIDVRRLPDKVLLPAAGWTTIILTAHAINTGNPASALTATGIGLAAGIAAWILHMLSNGGLGYGDVKLVVVLTASLALMTPELVLPALLGSCLIAIGASLITKSREMAFGPCLTVGCTAAAITGQFL